MAKRTPDYTKQVRHEKPRRQPAAAPRKKLRQKETVPPPPAGMTAIVFTSLFGGVALYAWAALLAAGGTGARTVAFSLTVAFCGLLTNIFTGVLAVYALNPERHPMPRVDKRTLVVVIVIFGAITVFFGINNMILAPGLIPPIAIFYFVIRPRLKAIAQVAGTYRPTRRDEALSEIQDRRAERQREKEREEQVKRALKRRQHSDPTAGSGRSRWGRGS